MLRIWGRLNSVNVQKVMWVIDELGLQHERIDAGGPFGGLDTDAYGALNPNRRVPTLEEGSLALWESNVIVRYLAAKHAPGGLCPGDPQRRALAEQWMDWQQTTLVPDMMTVFLGLVRTSPEERDQAAIDVAAARLEPIWAVLDRYLEGRQYVVGDEFTIGDIPVGAMYHRYRALGIATVPAANLTSWYERLAQRPSYRRHVMLPLS